MNQPSDNEDRDYETEARTSGWVPQDAWKGPADRWVDAKTFIQRGEEYYPFVQAKLKKEIGALKGEINELREGSKEFREFSEKAIERERKEKERVLSELEEARATAITNGDGKEAVRLEKEIREVEREPAPKPGLPAETQAWLAENAWYTTDPVLKGIADGLSDVVATENPGLKGRAFLDKLREKVQTEVPHKFQNSRRETALTEDHQRKSSSKKGRTYEDLPADARAACDKFVKQIPGYSKEKYIAQYDWSES
jgi:hypothetical protein